jgi:DsbC/DsbD-like thiol-disulfide interchange protein
MQRKSLWAQRAAFCAVVCALAMAPFALSSAPGDKADAHVKFTATAGKIDHNGQQTVAVVAEVAKGWHLYANPVKNEELDNARTVVAIAAANKLEKVEIKYPAGSKLTDKTFGDYLAYEGKVEITATLKRTAGDTGPLDVTVKYMVCSDKECVPGSAKLQAK